MSITVTRVLVGPAGCPTIMNHASLYSRFVVDDTGTLLVKLRGKKLGALCSIRGRRLELVVEDSDFG
jgi:hypothetical protein